MTVGADVEASGTRLLRLDSATAVEVTATSLRLPKRLEFEQWRALIALLERRGSTVAWWLGDALAAGERRYRRDYALALEQLYARSSLANLASVSRRVDVSRRRPALSWSHHSEVASLAPEEQERWLAEAESRGWSVHMLRDQLRQARATIRRRPTALVLRLDVDELRELIERAAAAAALQPAAWASRALEQTARRELCETSVERAALNRAAELVS